MKLGILEAGSPPVSLATQFPGYATMVAALLGDGFEARAYDVRRGVMPARARECDAWLVTGSSAGVYEADAWIAALQGFVAQASGEVPMIGICFGHQLLASAFGGQVKRSDKGWGIGLHRYALHTRSPWMDEGRSDIALPVSHQDQVIELPEGTDVLAGSAFTPYGVLSWPARRAMSIQAHPEFDVAYISALIEARRGTRFDDATADTALDSLAVANDCARVGGWLRAFLMSA